MSEQIEAGKQAWGYVLILQGHPSHVETRLASRLGKVCGKGGPVNKSDQSMPASKDSEYMVDQRGLRSLIFLEDSGTCGMYFVNEGGGRTSDTDF